MHSAHGAKACAVSFFCCRPFTPKEDKQGGEGEAGKRAAKAKAKSKAKAKAKSKMTKEETVSPEPRGNKRAKR